MLTQVKITVDENSIRLFKNCKGKTLIKIGYNFEKDFSLSTILIFDDFTVILKNTISVSCGEEYPKLSAEFAPIMNGAAGNGMKYEYFDVDIYVQSIEIMTDKVSWINNGTNEFIVVQNAVVLTDGTGNQILFYAVDAGAEAIAIYTDRKEFDARYDIEKVWCIDYEGEMGFENITHERVLEAL
jgi:hypothetical protein